MSRMELNYINGGLPMDSNFRWDQTWLYTDLKKVINSKDKTKHFMLIYITYDNYPISWLKECIKQCFPEYIGTLDKMLILK